MTVNADGTVGIPLHGRDGAWRAVTIIDAADAAWAGQWRWSLRDGYVVRSEKIDGRLRTFRLHRELLGLVEGDGQEGDHRDRDRLNNRRGNLRVTTSAGNSQNTPSKAGSVSAYRGVYWNKARQKWVASVGLRGVAHYLGGFDSERAAAEAAQKGRARLLPLAVD